MNYLDANKCQKDTLIGEGRVSLNPATGKPQKFNDKSCKFCGSLYIPSAPSHLYCCEACRKDASAERYLRRNYNISIKQWQGMHKKQEGLCAICGSKGFSLHPKSKVNIVVDHCHVTGKVRGLLCHNCNRALGLLQDSTDTLRNAIKYLESATTISSESTLK